MAHSKSFSKKWMLASMAIFVAVELLLGGLVGEVLIGGYMSRSLRFMVEGLFHIASFFVGGFIVGVISPGLRIHEPAAGAFLSVALMLLLAVFTPYTFLRFSLTRMLVGGVIAFCLALVGARLGERLTGNRVSDRPAPITSSHGSVHHHSRAVLQGLLPQAAPR